MQRAGLSNAALAIFLLASAELRSQPDTVQAAFAVAVTTPNALQLPLPALTTTERAAFSRGRELFSQVWVASPSVDTEVDGLGPLYNQAACFACHQRNGRGQPPESEHERMRSALVRLSIPGSSLDGGPLPHPVYGEQLNDTAITGSAPEGRAVIQWTEHSDYFADGDPVSLRHPMLTLSELAYGPVGENLLTSLRVAPPIIGAGLLDAVPDSTLEALAATPRPDGVSGRVNRVRDPTTGHVAVGKFGWKANAASLAQQTAAAFRGDLGITSRYYAVEHCPPQPTDCGLSTELDLTDIQLADVVFYQAALAVPAPRNSGDASVREGQRLFEEAGCQHCHLPTLTAGANALVPLLANTTFNAYTDLLLHDMGDALADGRPDYQAGPSEWRTAPLWGLGLLPTINEHQNLLHDGRARGVLEAIMWHGGEASLSRERVRVMNRQERDSIVAFVNSL